MRSLLVVEDEARVADFLGRGLRAEGYRVVLARDGMQALSAMEAERFTLLVIDVMLPGGLDGWELCRRVRARPETTPILMLSALDAVEDRVEGLRLGADDYLTKPFAFDELLARIAALIRRAHGSGDVTGARRLGDLIFDREALTVMRAGRRVDLTSKELALLELLISAPGRVFSRERILNMVWGIGEDPLTNVVDVYIGRLRRKLGLEGAGGLAITTVRGRGYRIEVVADDRAS